MGLKENVIIGKLIPAGTGLTAYHTFAEELVPGPAPVEAAPEPIPQSCDSPDIPQTQDRERA